MAFPDYTTSTNDTVRPTQELGDGGEGIVYALEGRTETVAKIYHPLLRIPEREHKLWAMIKSPPHDDTRHLTPPHVSIAWPIDVLYEQGTFAGFVMPRISDSPTIIQVYNPQLREKNRLSIDWRYLHHIGKNLATALNALHARGYVMGDVNQKNILVTSNALVTLIDTDSFQVHDDTNGKTYRCLVGVPDYTPPELQGSRIGTVDRKPLHDCFGLSVLMFQLLMEGFHPFSGVSRTPAHSLPGDAYVHSIANGHFAYEMNRECSPPPDAPAFSTVHPELRYMFHRSFVEGHRQPSARPTAREWIEAIDKAERDLVQCETNPIHWYSRHTHKCHWCERESMKPLPVQQPLAAPPSRASATGTQPSPAPVSTSPTAVKVSRFAKCQSDIPWLVVLSATSVGIAMVRLLSEYVGYVPYSPGPHLGMDDGPVGFGGIVGGLLGLLLGIVGPIYHAKKTVESVLGITVFCLLMIPFAIVLCPLVGMPIGMLAAWIITLLLPVILGLAFGAAGGILLAIAVEQYSHHDEIPAGCFLGSLAGGIIVVIAWATGNTFLANCLFLPLFAWVGYGIGRRFDVPFTAPSYPRTRSWLRPAAMCAGLLALGLFLQPAIMSVLGGVGLLVGIAMAINRRRRGPVLVGLAFCATACLGAFVGSELPNIERPAVQHVAVSTEAISRQTISPSMTSSKPSADRSVDTERNERTISPLPNTSSSNSTKHAETVSPNPANNSVASVPSAVRSQQVPETPQRSTPRRHIDLSGDWQGSDNTQFRIDDDGKTIAIRLVASPNGKRVRELSGTLTIPADNPESESLTGTVEALFFASPQRLTLRVILTLRDPHHLKLQYANWPIFDKNGKQRSYNAPTTFLTRPERNN